MSRCGILGHRLVIMEGLNRRSDLMVLDIFSNLYDHKSSNKKPSRFPKFRQQFSRAKEWRGFGGGVGSVNSVADLLFFYSVQTVP